MARFVHTADLQLGMSRRFLAPEAQARYAQARIDAIRSIGEVVRTTGAEFLVAAGDVFESNHVDRRVVGRALEAFGAIGVPVLLLPGNHDPMDAGSVYSSPAFRSLCPANVTVLGDDPVTVAGVEVVGAPWPTKRPVEDLVARRCRALAPPTSLRVLVGHGSVDCLFPERREPSLVGLAALEAAVHSGLAHYVALGDRHSTTSVGATGRIWYSGSPEPTDHDEIEPGQVLVVDLDDAGVHVERHRVGTWTFVAREARLSSGADIDALEAWLDGFADKGRAVIRLSPVGSLTLRDRARLDDLLDEQAPLFAALETWARTTDLAVLPDDVDAEELGVCGFARTALSELELLATDGLDADAAADALALAYRLSRPAA